MVCDLDICCDAYNKFHFYIVWPIDIGCDLDMVCDLDICCDLYIGINLDIGSDPCNKSH